MCFTLFVNRDSLSPFPIHHDHPPPPHPHDKKLTPREQQRTLRLAWGVERRVDGRGSDNSPCLPLCDPDTRCDRHGATMLAIEDKWCNGKLSFSEHSDRGAAELVRGYLLVCAHVLHALSPRLIYVLSFSVCNLQVRGTAGVTAYASHC